MNRLKKTKKGSGRDGWMKLKEVTVDRCFIPKGFGQVQEIQLHLFSDALGQRCSAAAYFREKDVDRRVHCSFVMGKARLATVRFPYPDLS